MRIAILIATVTISGGCMVSQKTTEPLLIAKDTYTLNVVTPTYYSYSASQIRNAAMVAASEHCAKSGKVMLTRDIDSSGNNFSSRMSSNITFSCVDESDPEFQRQKLQPEPEAAKE